MTFPDVLASESQTGYMVCQFYSMDTGCIVQASFLLSQLSKTLFIKSFVIAHGLSILKFLVNYSSMFRGLFRSKPGSNNTSDNVTRTENNPTIHLDGVTILEFESLLTFFYEGPGCDNVHCCTALVRFCMFIIYISDLFFFFFFPLGKRVSQCPSRNG